MPRMFVAVVPPAPVVEDLTAFLEPRDGLPWIASAQWHLTLAFFATVPEHRTSDLVDALTTSVGRREPFAMRIAGAGAFPGAARASVLWLGVDPPDAGAQLGALATNARNAANSVGATPDGRGFVPHLTVARLRRPVEATKWLRVLDTYRSAEFTVEDVELVASHLGEGPARRPRYETVARIPLTGSVRAARRGPSPR